MRVVQRTDLLILNNPMPMMESLLAFDKGEFFFFFYNLAEMRVVQRTDPFILNDPMPMMESLLAFDKVKFFFSY